MKFGCKRRALRTTPHRFPWKWDNSEKLKVALSVEAKKITVNVSDLGTERVDTISSVVDGVVNAHQIDNLPLNGRNFLELALLMPGNTIAPNFRSDQAEYGCDFVRRATGARWQREH